MEFEKLSTIFESYFSNYNGTKSKCEHKNVFTRSTVNLNEEDTCIKVSHQLCFVLDITGSMQTLIDSVKHEIVPMIDMLRNDAEFAIASLPDSENYILDFQVALVGYRDFDDMKQFEVHDFTSDIEKIKTFLSTLVADGGNDAAEDVKGAFIHTLFGLDDDYSHRLSWKTETASKSVYLITDAPAHGRKFHTQGVIGDNYLDDSETEWIYILRQLKKEVILFNIIKINQSISEMCREFEYLCRIEEVKYNVLDISQNIKSDIPINHLECIDLLDCSPILTLTSSVVIREVSTRMRETSYTYVSRGCDSGIYEPIVIGDKSVTEHT
jgi:hypothetical protein